MIGPVVLAALLVAVAGGVLWFRRDRARARSLAALAASEGWRYAARNDAMALRCTGPLFDQGERRRADNVLTGTVDGRPFLSMDYSFRTTSSDGRSATSVHRYAVCALGLPGFLPTLELTPESLLSRLGGSLGLADIDLESEQFNRRYRIRAADARFAYDVLPPATMQALLLQPPIGLRVSGDTAVCWEPGRSVPVRVLGRLSALRSLVHGIPSYVWNDHHTGGSAP